MRSDLTSSADYIVFARLTTSASPSSAGSSAGEWSGGVVVAPLPVISVPRTILRAEYMVEDSSLAELPPDRRPG
ncbi:MAG: hypothetical protein ACK6DV_33185 [Deltaproteobacteria bacterium]|jgi:hypothetical protein